MCGQGKSAVKDDPKKNGCGIEKKGSYTRMDGAKDYLGGD